VHEALVVSKIELQPILCSIPQASAMLGRGVGAIYGLIGDGKIRAVKSNGRTLIFVDSLREYANGLPRADVRPRYRKPQRLR
jgi:Helix-turn-helix domain